MKGEAVKVKTSVDEDGDTFLTIKRKFNLCLKISLIFQSVVERAEWEDSIPFNESIILPSNLRQFNMSLGINEASLITSDLAIRPFLEAMARSNQVEGSSSHSQGRT